MLLKVFVALGAAVLALVMTPAAHAQERTLTTFVTVLSAENEVPECPDGVDSGAHGVAVIQINAATGEISYRVVATNLPTTADGINAFGHIHEGAAGVRGDVVVPFDEGLTGLDTGLVAAGTATDEALADAILDNPENYYVNIHTTACPAGTIRGQLG